MGSHRSRSRDRSPKRHSSRKRSRSTSRDRRSSKHRHRDHRRSRSRDRHRHSPPHAGAAADKERGQSEADAAQEKQRQRQEKLAAWRVKQQQQEAATASMPAASAEPACAPSTAVWTPWGEEEAPKPAPVAPPPPAPASVFGAPVIEVLKERPPPPKPLEPLVETDHDPLDAFMEAEVMPEVKENEQEELERRAAEKRLMAKQLANGQIPKLSAIVEDSDSEEEPDAVVNIPINKVKLVVGAGGEKIKYIQRKSKCRLQIRKEEEELNTAFGTSSIQAKVKAMQEHKNPQGKTTAIMLFGNAKECETAQAMIEEAIDNREQKQKQRQKEYERKRDAKWRNRQMYHMRHTRDYEALGLPIGASKADVKKAYKQMAVQWHPDKHPEDPEGAKAKFQEISRAFQSLMTTDEDEIIQQLGHK